MPLHISSVFFLRISSFRSHKLARVSVKSGIVITVIFISSSESRRREARVVSEFYVYEVPSFNVLFSFASRVVQIFARCALGKHGSSFYSDCRGIS